MCVFWMTAAGSASAQIGITPYVSGLSSPVAFVQDPSDVTVHYVVEQPGTIRVIKNGVLLGTPFLDVSGLILCCGERGLLGLAFPPNYGATGRFFVNFTRQPDGHTVVARFRRSAGNLLQADPASYFPLVWPGTPPGPGITPDCLVSHPYICQPYANHNGGTIAFGPDGNLYIGMGDGGSGGDPENRAQNPAELLGKILRINVSVDDSDLEGYDIPAGNPFLAGSALPAALDEIWDFGVRNPWKFSFDDPSKGGTGALTIGDVGQNAWEEVDYEPAGAGGRNYGWRTFEGTHPYNTSLPRAFEPPRNPIYEYPHPTGISVTGGYVYRGSALGSLYVGRYFFGDLNGRVWSIGLSIGGGGEATANTPIEHTGEFGGQGVTGNITSFGVDAFGELYLVSYGGTIFRIVGSPAATGSDVVLDLGSKGLWTRYSNGVTNRLHVLSPTQTITADLDGNGQADLICAFQGHGVWVWANNSSWYQLHTFDAAGMTAGDLDGNGRTDLIIDFPSVGLWVWGNNTAWWKLHDLHPNRMITADVDGNGRADAILNFQGYGVWIWMNNTSWFQLHVLNAAAMTAGDVDGNGRADVLLDFPGHGLWLWSNNAAWSQLHVLDATMMAMGDVDGNGRADVFISFAGYGVWGWMNNASWTQLHALDAALVNAADIDGSGRADIVISFPGKGVWAWKNNAGWVSLNTQNPEMVTTGNLDGF
jgi:glucose/arabinose dehydrogenase